MQPQNTPEENIFTVKPAEPTRPENNKRSTLIGVTVTIIVVLLMIGGLFFATLAGAQNAATNYKIAAKANLEEVLVKAGAIQVSEVANRRDITKDIATVEGIAQQHPQLEPSLFANEVSGDYRAAAAQQVQNGKYLDKLVSALKDLPHLVPFNEGVEQIKSELDILLNSVPSEPTAANARTLAGTIDGLTRKVSVVETPQSLHDQRQMLQQVYEGLAESYREYATAKDDKKPLKESKKSIATAQQSVQDATAADTSQRIILYMQELLHEGKTLKDSL